MKYYKKDGDRGARRSNEDTFGNLLKQMLAAYGLKEKYQEAQLKNTWETLMGGSIAKQTENLYLKNGKLYILVRSASLRQELAYSKEKIIERLNDELGEIIIKEVIVK